MGHVIRICHMSFKNLTLGYFCETAYQTPSSDYFPFGLPWPRLFAAFFIPFTPTPNRKDAYHEQQINAE